MLALSIRQPFAELILRGLKTIEYRSRATTLVGQRFYLYAPLTRATLPVWSMDLEAAQPPAWLAELARQVKLIEPDAELPRGVIVGTAVISRCEEGVSDQGAVASKDKKFGSARTTGHSPLTTLFQWHLADVKRLEQPRKPKGHPQPVWFKPF